MSDLVSDNSTKQGAMLTKHFDLIGRPHEPPKKPAGTYVCLECGDVRIVFHTPQDEYKTKCPKCSAQMVRAKKPLTV